VDLAPIGFRTRPSDFGDGNLDHLRGILLQLAVSGNGWSTGDHQSHAARSGWPMGTLIFFQLVIFVMGV